MKAALFVLLALAALTLPSIASAGPQPVAYYLKDSPKGSLEDGTLNTTRPTGTQQASLRPVPVAATAVVPAQFLSNGASHPTRIVGPVYVALWTGPSVVAKGNLTATIFLFSGGKQTPLANASVVLDANASKAPQPTALVPGNPTGDPQASANSEINQLLPVVTPPAKLLYLGFVNTAVDADAKVGVSFALTPGSSGLLAPAGAAATIQYNGTYQPSFVYIPWYAASAPPTPTTPPRYTAPTRAAPTTNEFVGTPAAQPQSGGGSRHGLPAPDLMVGLLTLASVFVALRRRST